MKTIAIRSGRVLTIAMVTVAWMARVGSAHPGHAPEVVSADSAMHYFLQPEHGVPWAILLIVAAMGYGLHRRLRTPRLKAAPAYRDMK